MQPVDSGFCSILKLSFYITILKHIFPFTASNQNTLILWLEIKIIINNIIVINIIITLLLYIIT